MGTLQFNVEIPDRASVREVGVPLILLINIGVDYSGSSERIDLKGNIHYFECDSSSFGV